MSDPTTGREALLAELIGEVAELMRHVDTVAPAIIATCDSIEHAAARLQQQAVESQLQFERMCEGAKTASVKYLTRHVSEAAHRTVEAQAHTIRSIAHDTFRAELEVALRQVARFLNDQAALRTSRNRSWALIATTLVTAMITAALTAYVILP